MAANGEISRQLYMMERRSVDFGIPSLRQTCKKGMHGVIEDALGDLLDLPLGVAMLLVQFIPRFAWEENLHKAAGGQTRLLPHQVFMDDTRDHSAHLHSSNALFGDCSSISSHSSHGVKGKRSVLSSTQRKPAW